MLYIAKYIILSIYFQSYCFTRTLSKPIVLPDIYCQIPLFCQTDIVKAHCSARQILSKPIVLSGRHCQSPFCQEDIIKTHCCARQIWSKPILFSDILSKPIVLPGIHYQSPLFTKHTLSKPLMPGRHQNLLFYQTDIIKTHCSVRHILSKLIVLPDIHCQSLLFYQNIAKHNVILGYCQK